MHTLDREKKAELIPTEWLVYYILRFLSGLRKLPMYPTVTSFRPPSGMRCDSRLLSSFITGALTATTVTLFLLRVVPGTYVVLPCDPTITVRPILMEEYFERVDKQQEIFSDDGAVDTRPLHAPGVVDAAALHHRKSSHLEKHRNQKKRKKTPLDQKFLQEKQDSQGDGVSSKEISEGPKDLQQQLKDLQEKEEREKALKGAPQLVAQKQHIQQKRKQQHEQQQVKQHLKELQLHLQQKAEETRRKQLEESERNIREQRKRLEDAQKHSQTNSQQNQVLPHSKYLDKKKQKEKEINNHARENQIPGRAKRESHLQGDISQRDKDDKYGVHQKPPDSKLLRGIMSHREEAKSEQHNPHGLQSNGYYQSLSQQNNVNSLQEASKQKSTDARDNHKVTDITVPKLSRIP